ncbi:hypothetical protein AGABI1DRAFT_110668 [Agaricus bisporus var. burnettii JB137-S8]|uniref:DUF6534 domain-containing protein n=2 Tax=Agaricus bisporus var. burnettii TaxID=192524 RepID=K5Y7A1_AGABU|nr:uncharacterized protein AGABI1DRAFT_110668 [Agaricus bisporus var. burnettii JB137-S8]EKM84080.1 hypothetical protein AGABI1DRAFT_110668 [Agaricus bisporus var. burnettii JB137-S8]KAF7784124.1 hypothetical protein Agabi119p4_289 [Agaricus bisporus var. burnettii]
MGDFDLIVGPLLIGLFFNTYLYGLVTYQFLVYKTTKFNDPTWIKIVVALLFVCDTLHSGVAVYAGWEMCVTNFNHPELLIFVGWTIPFTACATAVAALLTQGFLAHRVLLLTKSKVITAIILVLSVVGFVFGMYAGVRCGIIDDSTKFAPLKPYVGCWLGFQTAADISITAVLSYSLSRSRTGFRKTDTLINRLIRGAIQTGLFASIFALADLFSFTLAGTTTLYAMFAYPIGRIYTNTLLDTLNARIELKRGTAGTIDAESGNTYSLQNHSRTLAPDASTHSIQVQKETVTDGASLDAKYPIQ